MTRAEPLHPEENSTVTTISEPESGSEPAGSLRDSVSVAVRRYLDQLDGQMSTDVYQMVLAEIEAPLLEEIMAYTRNNQTKASLMLGLNRGTLRKKLKQYNLISDKDQG
jgi:Fis family transcriptional regulator